MHDGGPDARTAPARSDALDCVVCGQEIGLDDEVVVVWSADDSHRDVPDLPLAVSLARCQGGIDVAGDRTTGPYTMREALTDILESSRLRGGRRRVVPAVEGR